MRVFVYYICRDVARSWCLPHKIHIKSLIHIWLLLFLNLNWDFFGMNTEPLKLRLEKVKIMLTQLPTLGDIESIGVALDILEIALKELRVIRWGMSFQQQFDARKKEERDSAKDPL